MSDDSSDDEYVPVGKLAIHQEDEEEDEQRTTTPAASNGDGENAPAPATGAGTSTSTSPEIVAELTQFDSFANLLQSTSEAELIRGCAGIRKLLCMEQNPPYQLVIDSGSVPRFVQLMKESNSVAIQYESAWVLTNITSGTSSQTRSIVNAGAIGGFVTLLTHSDVDVRETAAWALSNIAGDSADHRDQVIRAGALQPLLSLATNSESSIEIIRNCAQAIANMFDFLPRPNFNDLKAAVPVLAQLLFSEDGDVLYFACLALTRLTCDTPNNYQILTVTQIPSIVPRLVALLSHRQADLKEPILRSLSSIAGGDDVHTRLVIDAGAIPAFVKLLQSRKKAIRRALGKCTEEHLQTLIDAGVFPLVIRIVQEDEPEVRTEGIWVLSNSCFHATTFQIHYLVDEAGIMEPLVETLFPECEEQVAQLAIEALDNILQSGVDEFVDDPKHPHPYRDRLVELGIIEGLREVEAHHDHESVRTKAKELLDEYFAGISPLTNTTDPVAPV